MPRLFSLVRGTREGVSNLFTVNYAKFAPGLFAGSGNFLAAQHGDSSYVRVTSPAHIGETVVLWGTGFEPSSPAVPAGMVFAGACALANAVEVTIGGLKAVVEFAGMVGTGLVQLNVRVPPGVSGQAPVVATVGGVSTQTSANLIAVAN